MTRNLEKIAVVLAGLAVGAQFQLRAQNQPQPKQAPNHYSLVTASYNLLIASGFLCENTDGCPAVAQASDGQTIEISGAGRLDLGQKSVAVAGAFTEKTAGGTISATGVWTSTALVSFQPYGVAPLALLREYPQLRTVGMFSMGRPMMPGLMMAGPMGMLMAGPLAAGGLAVIRIHLLPDAGAPEDALLSINCAQGKAPEQAQSDSVKLTITGDRAFDVPVAGRDVFLLQRPMPGFAWNRGRSQATANTGR